MILIFAAAAQVDDATLRQRETNPEHQEAELREALHGAVGTDSRDGAWEKFKLEAGEAGLVQAMEVLRSNRLMLPSQTSKRSSYSAKPKRSILSSWGLKHLWQPE